MHIVPMDSESLTFEDCAFMMGDVSCWFADPQACGHSEDKGRGEGPALNLVT